MSALKQEAVFEALEQGMKRGRSLTRELKHMPKSIAVLKGKDCDTPTVIVSYYGTAIVTAHPNGRVTLNDGGWKTASTRRYINAALNTLFPGIRVGVSQNKGNQILSYHETVTGFNGELIFNILNGELIIYETGH